MAILRLTIEPAPVSSRLATLAKLLPANQWNRIRRSIYRSAGYRCRICTRPRRLDCHEVWQYNERTGYQLLRGFRALCRDCHNVKHILFVRNERDRARLLRHFITVNRLSRRQAQQYLRTAARRQRKLNQTNWVVNFGGYNWQVPPLKNVRQRRAYLGRASRSQCR